MENEIKSKRFFNTFSGEWNCDCKREISNRLIKLNSVFLIVWKKSSIACGYGARHTHSRVKVNSANLQLCNKLSYPTVLLWIIECRHKMYLEKLFAMLIWTLKQYFLLLLLLLSRSLCLMIQDRPEWQCKRQKQIKHLKAFYVNFCRAQKLHSKMKIEKN